MNKMKAAAAELRQHLGTDSCGVKLLAALMREANATRKALAASQQELRQSTELVQVLRSKALVLGSQELSCRKALRRAKDDVRKYNGIIADKQRQIDELELILEPPITIAPENKLSNRARFKSLFKNLRKQMPVPPTPCFHEISYRFELADIVNDYNQDQYTRLGMFVVACCVMNWPVGFAMKENTRELGVEESDGGEVGKFVRWVKNNWIKDDPAWKDAVSEKCFRFASNEVETTRGHR